jgi:CBS domain-containing protein
VGKELAVVCDENESPIGIISVIDINRAVVMYGDRAPGMTVRDVMSTDMVVCGRSDSVEHALDVMMKWGIRHLPVVAEGRLEGIVNIQDLLEARFDEAQLGLDEMRPYVFGVGLHQTARHDTN